MTPEQKAKYGFIKLTEQELKMIGIRKHYINGLAYYRARGGKRKVWKGIAPGFRRSTTSFFIPARQMNS